MWLLKWRRNWKRSHTLPLLWRNAEKAKKKKWCTFSVYAQYISDTLSKGRNIALYNMLCLLPRPLAYSCLPFWFILLHFLQNLSKQRLKCVELWKNFDLWLDELCFTLIQQKMIDWALKNPISPTCLWRSYGIFEDGVKYLIFFNKQWHLQTARHTNKKVECIIGKK